jgi:hypothetical protein
LPFKRLAQNGIPPFEKAVRIAWALAVLAAVINGLFLFHRLAALRAQVTVGDDAAARSAAAWLRREPSSARLLLLRSHRDVGAVWFDFRLNYFTYPMRHESAWESLPSGALRSYDLVLALDSARSAVPREWTIYRRAPAATLYAADPRRRPLPLSSSPPYSGLPVNGLPAPVRAASGLFALAVVYLLGSLLLCLTLSSRPFQGWWANLALAHLAGAAALSLFVTVVAILCGRLLVWPVYLLVALLLPTARRSFVLLYAGDKRKPDAGGDKRESGAGGDPEKSVRAIPCDQTHAATSTGTEPRDDGALSRLRIQALAGVVALGAAMLLACAFVLHVGWDGYSIWQFKALAFLADGNLSMLRDPHYAYYAHADYPLLVPLQTWWASAHFGGYREGWAQLIGALFTLDLLALFVAFARPRMSAGSALIGAALLATLPELSKHGVSGFADVEMACYFLAVAILLARIVSAETGLWPVLAWMLAGIVQVKNEGVPAALGCLILLALYARSRSLRGIAVCITSACAGCLPWFAIRHAWRLSNDVLESGRAPRLTLGLLSWRLTNAVAGFVRILAQTGPRAGAWGLVVVMIPIGLIETLRRRARICNPLWSLCAVQFAAYVCIYVVTWKPMLFHMQTSADRLLLHLVPTALLASLVATFGDEPCSRPARPDP